MPSFFLFFYTLEVQRTILAEFGWNLLVDTHRTHRTTGSAGPWSWAAGFVGYPIPNFPQSFWQKPSPPMNHAPRPTVSNFSPEAHGSAVPSPCHLRFSTRRRRGSNERPFRLAGDRFHPCDAHLRTRGFPTRELGRCPSDRSGSPGRARSTAVGYYARPRPSPLPTTRAPGGLR